MRIQIASFALVPDHIYIAEKNFHAEKLILLLSDENQDESKQENAEVISSIEQVEDFYKKMDVPVERIHLNYKNFMETALKVSYLLNTFSNKDELLLNLSGGRRSIPIALFYAATFIKNIKDIDIKCVIIPEDKSYMPFSLLPKYFPDEIDMKLMSSLSLNKPLTELETMIGIKQPTISMRLKKLEKYGYIFVKGRQRILTELGNMIVNIYKI